MAAAAEIFGGMNDSRLKPPMLRSVVRDRLPDEKRPFTTFAELIAVLSHVRSHGLLSEQHSDPADPKLVESWKVAVDGWVERILSLASSKESYKRWAGTCLLGLTCEECCSDRFQSSYSIWFLRLLENIQSPSCTRIVKVACCASLDDLFTRLSCFPNLKKDGTLFAGKLVQLVLQLLNEDAEEILWVAVNLLCTLLSFFPSAIQRHYGNVEDALSSKIIAANFNFNLLKMFANGLALLPKVKGDENSWCLIIQKVLIAINTILNDAFEGFEEEKKSSEVMKMIISPGKEPPPPLGGQTLSGEANVSKIKKLRELLVPRVTTLMDTLCIMLTNPYPLPLSIPVHALLATVGRVLQVDASFHGSLFPLTTTIHQELLCAELPSLHLSSLDLLIAIIKSLRSQLLPHGANVVRLLTEYFRKSRLPSLRIKVYSIVRMLLISMGVGMTVYLAQEVVNNAFTDLIDYLGLGKSSLNLNKKPSITMDEAVQQNHCRKRKRASVMPFEFPSGADISIKTGNKIPQTALSVQISALKALEALLTVGGSLRSERWRPDVDYLVVIVATNACDAGWADEDKMYAPSAESFTFADFQLATLEVLLASLLSPIQGRPTYLSQGLDLFHKGRQETGTKLAAFCAHALLALEVLIHPRALPLEDHPSKNSSYDDFNQNIASITFHNGIKSNLPSFSKGDLEVLDEDEELSNSWFERNGEQTSIEDRNLNNKHAETTKQSSKCSEDITENPSSANAEVCHVLECENKFSQNVDVEMDCLGQDEFMVDSEKAEASFSRNAISLHNVFDNKLDSSQGSPPISATKIAPVKSDSFFGDSLIYHGSDAKVNYDSDSSSLNSLPSIVDGDPDTE